MSHVILDQIGELIRQGCTCPPAEVLSEVLWLEDELPVYTFRHRSDCPYMCVKTAPQLDLTPKQLPDTT